MTKETLKLVSLTVVASLVVSAGFNLLADRNVPVVREIRNVVGSAGNEYGQIVLRNGASLNGAVLQGVGSPFLRGTTTPCSLQTPTNATTSLVSMFVNTFRNATDTARVLYIGTSTARYSTSSTALIATRDVAGNEKVAFTASTTQEVEGQYPVGIQFAPGEYVTVNFKGGNHIMGVGTTTELDGYCSLLLNAEAR